MTQHRKWQLITVGLYIVYLAVAFGMNFITPAKVGLAWTIFWVVVGAGICYYLYFKNLSYQEVIYYARKLNLNQGDLEAMVPDRKEKDLVPNPDKPNLFSPIAQVQISTLNVLTDELEKRAKEQGIPAFE